LQHQIQTQYSIVTDKECQVWDSASGNVTHTWQLTNPEGWPLPHLLNGDKVIVRLSDNQYEILDVKTRGRSKQESAASLLTGDSLFRIDAAGNVMSTWSGVMVGKWTAWPEVAKGDIAGDVMASPSGTRLTVSDNFSLKMWNIQTQTSPVLITGDNGHQFPHWTPDERCLLIETRDGV
jgi:hypothetical protein